MIPRLPPFDMIEIGQWVWHRVRNRQLPENVWWRHIEGWRAFFEPKGGKREKQSVPPLYT